MTTAMPVISSSGMPANAAPLKGGSNILTGEAARTNDFSNSILALLSQMPGTQNSQLKDGQNASADPSQTNLLDLLQQMGLRGNFSLKQQKDGVNNRSGNQNALQWLQDLQGSQYDLPALQANKLEEWKKYLTPLFGLPLGAFQPLDAKMVNYPMPDGNLLSIAAPKGFGQDRLMMNLPTLPDLATGASLPSLQNASPNIALFTDTLNGSAMQGLFDHSQSGNSNLNPYPLAFLQSSAPVTFMTMTKIGPKAELANKAIASLDSTAAGSLLNYGSLSQMSMPYGHGHLASNPIISTSPPSHFPFVAMPMAPPPEFGQDLSERIQWMEKVGLSSMRLNLNPPQLGNLQVMVTVNDANQGAHVQFLASTPQMVQILTNHFGDLRDQLATFGFNNMSFDVGYHQNSNPQNESQKPLPGSQRYQLTDDDDTLSMARIMPARNGRVDDYA
jgi:hypothetical protein